MKQKTFIGPRDTLAHELTMTAATLLMFNNVTTNKELRARMRKVAEECRALALELGKEGKCV